MDNLMDWLVLLGSLAAVVCAAGVVHAHYLGEVLGDYPDENGDLKPMNRNQLLKLLERGPSREEILRFRPNPKALGSRTWP